ncbi:MAG TPA: protein meaA [Kineosporiaceae bacterium]|nr:protein meaA [Kineosporiaceae bacterium]
MLSDDAGPQATGSDPDLQAEDFSATMVSRPERDRPWVMRTYAGHSSPVESNALYRRNLDKGQTGLSVAFDLPTQTGYDADHALSRGEVGKVGVPIQHLGDLKALFDGIPLTRMNTSMTINAPAMWLLALYQEAALEQAAATSNRAEPNEAEPNEAEPNEVGQSPESVLEQLSGTTQNDIIKEYLSRGTYVFPPGPSLRLTTDTIAYTVAKMPRWNPVNICSYHLQEAGATPVQEVAFAMCTAIAVLDAVRDSGQVAPEKFGDVVQRISFFVNAGVRFVEEMCKMRAFVELWDEITRERYGITDAKQRRLRYGVQVNSLGLTEAQPENNVQRIVLEMLAVTLSKNARARAVQLPAWNEALGLPRPWDQQWSLRLQQVLAYESDLLEYGDIFDGSPVIEAKVGEILVGARAEIERIQQMGGAVAAVETGYMKSALVAAHAARRGRIETGQDVVVGVNKFVTTEPNPLTADLEQAIQSVDPAVESAAVQAVQKWRAERDGDPGRREAAAVALRRLRDDARTSANLMSASLDCARAGVTTGEWADTLREVFGEYRAPTGVGGVVGSAGSAATETVLQEVREAVRRTGEDLGGRLRLLVGKPGLDGHSNGAEQVAVRARDVGFEVIYQGIRLTPAQIVAAAVAEDVQCVGLSVLSGSHLELVPEVLEGLRAAGVDDVPVIVGGIIPEADERKLLSLGVAAVFTPKDYGLTEMMAKIVDQIRIARGLEALSN